MSRPMGSKNKSKYPAPEGDIPDPVEIDCVARTYVCKRVHSSGLTFNNFVIAELEIRDGVVVSIKESDPLNQIEAEIKKEAADTRGLDNLNFDYNDGVAMRK